MGPEVKTHGSLNDAPTATTASFKPIYSASAVLKAGVFCIPRTPSAHPDRTRPGPALYVVRVAELVLACVLYVKHVQGYQALILVTAAGRRMDRRYQAYKVGESWMESLGCSLYFSPALIHGSVPCTSRGAHSRCPGARAILGESAPPRHFLLSSSQAQGETLEELRHNERFVGGIYMAVLTIRNLSRKGMLVSTSQGGMNE